MYCISYCSWNLQKAKLIRSRWNENVAAWNTVQRKLMTRHSRLMPVSYQLLFNFVNKRFICVASTLWFTRAIWNLCTRRLVSSLNSSLVGRIDLCTLTFNLVLKKLLTSKCIAVAWWQYFSQVWKSWPFINVMKYHIGCVRPLSQGKPVQSTDQDILLIPGVGVRVRVWCVSASHLSVWCAISLYPPPPVMDDFVPKWVSWT